MTEQAKAPSPSSEDELRKAIIDMVALAAFIRMRCTKENAELWEDAGKIVIRGKAALRARAALEDK